MKRVKFVGYRDRSFYRQKSIAPCANEMLALDLSQQDIALARTEAEAVCGTKGELVGHWLLVSSSRRDLCEILAYTKRVGRLGFVGRLPSTPTIKKLIKGPFAFSFEGVDSDAKKSLLAMVPHLGHHVDLEKPTTRLLFVGAQGKLICVVDAIDNKQTFEKRKSHLMPAPHPSGMHPRLARAMVNLTGISKGVLLDPFCGSGGILIEAGLRGLKPTGVDISTAMLERAKKNLDHFGVHAKLVHQDALKIGKKYAYIATDLPYGKGAHAPKGIIEDFLVHLPTILGKRAVIGLPVWDGKDPLPEVKRILTQRKLRVVDEFTYYLHQSLSKKIVIVERR